VTTRLTVLVSGSVQGVGFRYWVREQAEPLGLRGAATNLRDGRVEVVAEGTRAACEQLLAVLGGRTPGRVHDLVPSWSAPCDEPPGFRVLSR
jgi:acylphosphatase